MPVAASAWHQRLLCQRADTTALTRFVTAFRNKGRLSAFLAKVPVHIIVNPNVGLVGAVFAGETFVENARYRLSRTPAEVKRASPSLGQDNQYVLEKLLGYSDDRISDLVANGVLG